MKPKASVVYRKLEDLKKLEGNPRQIKKEDLERLKESIKNNGDMLVLRISTRGNSVRKKAVQFGIK